MLGSQGEGEGSNMQKRDTSQSTNPFNDRMEKMRWCRAVDWTRNKYVFRKFSPDKSRQLSSPEIGTQNTYISLYNNFDR